FFFSELRHMHNKDFLGQYNINLARQVAMGFQLRLRFEQEAKLLRKSVAQVARREQRIQAREHERGAEAGVEYGHAQRSIESLEAYDPEAEAKFAASLQSLKDLKLPLLDQLEGLKDAPMDVIMASLYLEDNTGGGCSIIYTRPPSQLLSACHPGIPRVVPQGLALILVDAATQTDPDA
nr:transposase (putative), gypsy type [Tanacetum cinerariifolium]